MIMQIVMEEKLLGKSASVTALLLAYDHPCYR